MEEKYVGIQKNFHSATDMDNLQSAIVRLNRDFVFLSSPLHQKADRISGVGHVDTRQHKEGGVA